MQLRMRDFSFSATSPQLSRRPSDFPSGVRATPMSSRVWLSQRAARILTLPTGGDGFALLRARARTSRLSWVSVDGDSLFAVRSGSAQPVAIADVLRAEERRFSGRRTTLLVVGVVVGGFVGLVGLMLPSGGGGGGGY